MFKHLARGARHSIILDGSENCAASAATRAKIFLELILVDCHPGDDHAEQVSLSAAVGGGDLVALLTTASVHDGQRLLGDHAGLLTANAVQLVDASGG